MSRRHAFTLIELLIVVAIIAILAAIAVPNFLEAQTRAKVSRAKSDMRSLATAIEAYVIDWNRYPIASQWVSASPHRPTPDRFNNRLHGVTTPQAYITSLPLDPFTDRELMVYPWDEKPTYEYEDLSTAVAGEALPGCQSYNLFANRQAYFEYFGLGRGTIAWNLLSAGPDRRNDFQQYAMTISSPAIGLGANNTYDATNGTVSRGDVIRTNAEQRN